MAERAPFESEYRVVWPDGSEHWVSVRGVFQYDDKSAPTRLLGIMMDVTARKRTEEALTHLNAELERRVEERTAALAESETRFHTIFDTAADGLILRSLKRGRFTLANDAALRMLGYTLEEFTSLRIEDLHLPEDIPFIRGEIAKFSRRQMVPGGDVRFKRKDGNLILVELHPTTFRLGGKDYVLLAIRDITERKRLEAAVLKATEDERQRIGRELHDGLGQTITGISYLIEALHREPNGRRDRVSADTRRLVELAGRATREVHELARGMSSLNVNRHGIVVALQELAANTQAIYGVRCRFVGPAPVPLPDENVSRQLFRIAQEAVNNAVRHSKGKAIRITLSRRRGRVTLTVRDDGKGIRATAREGTGMGLRIMQYRAEAIGGKLEIDSPRGKGTAVTCVLPPDVRPARRQT